MGPGLYPVGPPDDGSDLDWFDDWWNSGGKYQVKDLIDTSPDRCLDGLFRYMRGSPAARERVFYLIARKACEAYTSQVGVRQLKPKERLCTPPDVQDTA